jgi:thiol-disulfide isomerase/thioredoxin
MVKRLAVGLTLVALLSGCSFSVPEGYRPTPTDMPTIGVTQLAPLERDQPISFSGETLYGEKFNLDSIEGPIVLNAWASWCTQCKGEWPAIVSAQEKFKGVTFVGLNEADNKEAALEFIAKFGDNWNHVYDPEQKIAIDNKILPGPYLPITVVLDKQHRIASRIVGGVTETELNAVLTTLTAE